MKILIVGYGYVGKAISSVFRKKELFIVDPKYFRSSIESYSNIKFDLVFVCVDTPTGDNFYTLYSVINDLNRYLKKGTVVCCKSTAPPSFYSAVSKEFKNLSIVYSPEYLSHHSNIKDFNSQTFLILGGKERACRKISSVLKNRIKTLKNIRYTDIETAAFVKYAENAFLAYKVTFFNELFDIHKQLDLKTSFKKFVYLLTLDNRIGTSHTQVPGRDGMRGWGGHCFDKDNLEFQKFTKSKLIEFMRKINKLHRSK